MRATTGSRATGCSTRCLRPAASWAAGDLRLLYLGWLLKIQLSGLDDEDADFDDGGEGLADGVEPPVPAGLRQLSDSLASAAKFLRIDDDLIAVAAKAEPPAGAGQR